LKQPACGGKKRKPDLKMRLGNYLWKGRGNQQPRSRSAPKNGGG
jgi:hypothetical protein